MPATETDRLTGLTTSVAVKAPVRAATTGNITLSGLQGVDGVSLAEGDRVLVKNQTNTPDNGIYVASSSTWQRALDFDGQRDAVQGTTVQVISGSLQQNHWFNLTSSNPVTIGTDPITWTQTYASLTLVTTATEMTAGVAEIATQVETDTGTDDNSIVSPKKLANSALAATVAANVSGLSTLSSTVVALENILVGRNKLINGSMTIDQRGAGSTVNLTSSAAMFVDRWSIVTNPGASGTLTVQRQTLAPGNPPYCIRIARSAGSFVGLVQFGQVIRTLDAQTLAGLPVTLSFKARKGAGYAAGLSATIRTGTASDEGFVAGHAGTWTGLSDIATTSLTLTTSFQTFSITGTLGASVREIMVVFGTGAFAGSGGATDYLDITDVQLEQSSIASFFERQAYANILLACQPYYQKSFSPETLPAQNVGLYLQFPQPKGASASQSVFILLPIRMIKAPSITLFNSSAANAAVRNTATSTDWTSVSLAANADYGFRVLGTSPSGTAVGDLCAVNYTADAEI